VKRTGSWLEQRELVWEESGKKNGRVLVARATEASVEGATSPSKVVSNAASFEL
jgi:hypothetical protein